jgi:hypothetical protein
MHPSRHRRGAASLAVPDATPGFRKKRFPAASRARDRVADDANEARFGEGWGRSGTRLSLPQINRPAGSPIMEGIGLNG